MKLIVKQGITKIEVTIDTKDCVYPYQIKTAMIMALKTEGWNESFINDIFRTVKDAEPHQEEPYDNDCI